MKKDVDQLMEFAIDVAPDEFSLRTFELLNRIIGTDGAHWVFGSEDVHKLNEIPTLDLYGIDMRVIEDAADYAEQDYMSPLVRRRPGKALRNTDVLSEKALKQLPLYSNVIRPHRLHQVLGAAWTDRGTSIQNQMSLFRDSPSGAFCDSERDNFEQLMPYLSGMRIFNKINSNSRNVGVCLATAPDQRIKLANEKFREFVKIADPAWNPQSKKLAQRLCNALTSGAGQLSDALTLDVTSLGNALLIELTPRDWTKALSFKQARILDLIASGAPSKSIAKSLNSSASHVDNLISAMMKASGAKNRSRLAGLWVESHSREPNNQHTSRS